MNNYSCCICLCAYNSEVGLPRVLKNVKTISNLFKRIKVLFFYDHCLDKTLLIIQDFLKDNPGMGYIYINPNKKTNSRTENIAIARNGLLQRIKNVYIDYEYFMMIDTNHYSCVGDINTSVIEEVFSQDNIYKWDAVSFDREAGYYDHFALSFGNFTYSFLHFEDSEKAVEKLREEFSLLLDDYKKNKPDEFMPVYSAFNGFAIYKTAKFIDCSYSSMIDLSLFNKELVDNQINLTGCKLIHFFERDCEHRHFHFESIKKNKSKIMIYPKYVFRK